MVLLMKNLTINRFESPNTQHGTSESSMVGINYATPACVCCDISKLSVGHLERRDGTARRQHFQLIPTTVIRFEEAKPTFALNRSGVVCRCHFTNPTSIFGCLNWPPYVDSNGGETIQEEDAVSKSP